MMLQSEDVKQQTHWVVLLVQSSYRLEHGHCVAVQVAHTKAM